jgi:hypothetical protein
VAVAEVADLGWVEAADATVGSQPDGSGLAMSRQRRAALIEKEGFGVLRANVGTGLPRCR